MKYDVGKAYDDGYKTGFDNGYKSGYNDAMKKISSPHSEDLLKVDEIICREFSVSLDELHKRSRLRYIIDARILAIYIRKKIFNLSFKQAGDDFKLDHATAMHAVIQVENLLINDKTYKSKAQKALSEAMMIKNLS